jgi:hypothetical protein
MEEGGERMTIADPGKKYQDLDVIVEEGLPWMRLILAGISGNKCFVYFERGGRAYTRHLEIYRVVSGIETQLLWHGSCNVNTASLRKLREKYHAGQCTSEEHSDTRHP